MKSFKWFISSMLLVDLLGFAAGAMAQPAASLPTTQTAELGRYCPIARDASVLLFGDSIGGPHDIIPELTRSGWKGHGINISLGGNIVLDALCRMDRDAIRTELDHDVDWYFIMFGANDSGSKPMVQGGYEAAYRKLISGLKRRTHARIVLVCAPCLSYEDRGKPTRNSIIASMRDILQKLGKEYGVQVVNLFDPTVQFAKENGNTVFAKDGIHPSPEAHKFMAEVVLRQMNFYDMQEWVQANLADKQCKATDGCAASLEAAGDHALLRLVNLYDGPRQVGLAVSGLAPGQGIYDQDGKKLEVADGRCIVSLPAVRVWTEDLRDIRAITPTDDLKPVLAVVDAIEREVKAGQTRTLTIAAQAPAPDLAEPTSIYVSGVSLLKAAQALPAGEAQDKVRAAAERFVGQFVDLRIRLATAPKPVPANGMGTIGRSGDAAAHPKEKIEAYFINSDCPSLSGSLRIAGLPAKGWQAKPLTPTEFHDLKPGQRFKAEFELTGEETCSYEGEMIVAAQYELDGIKQVKEMPMRLFSPFLGIGAFCDSPEQAKASMAEKIKFVYEPEKTIDVAASYKRSDGAQLTWKPFRSFYSFPGIDRSGEVIYDDKPIGANEPVFSGWEPSGINYIAKWVYSPKTQEVLLVPEIDCPAARLWLNGQPLVVLDDDPKITDIRQKGLNWTPWHKTYFAWANVGGEAKTVKATLKEGWNVVLFKLVSAAGANKARDSFGLWIWDKDKKPVADLLGSCVPPAK